MSEPCYCVVDAEGRVIAMRREKHEAEEALDTYSDGDKLLMVVEAEMHNGVVTITEIPGLADLLGGVTFDFGGIIT